MGEIAAGELIQFFWEVEGVQCHTDISLTEGQNDTTVVRIAETGNFDNSNKALKFIKSNTEGWANFLACLKAWLEYGINLRKGAFEFYRKAN